MAAGPYASINIGLAQPQDSEGNLNGDPIIAEYDLGTALGVAVGNDLGNNIRIEGELAFQSNDINNINVPGVGSSDVVCETRSTALLLNGYYDIKNLSNVSLFFTVGAGLARVDIDSLNIAGAGPTTSSDDDTVYAYQVGVGAGFGVTEKVTLDVKYRYFATANPEFDASEIELASHNVYAGIRVGF